MRNLIFVVALLLGISLLAACGQAPAAPAPTAPAAPTATAPPSAGGPVAAKATPAPSGPVVLEIVGLDGAAKQLTMEQIKALPAVEGWAGIKSSTGRIFPPVKMKGVSLTELAKLVGGVSAETGLNVQAKDGYAMTLSYPQVVQGDFITYDPGTGDETKIDDPMIAALAYEADGRPLNREADGDLRLVVVSAKNNQVIDGHWSVKWVTRVELKPMEQEWTVTLRGAIEEIMDRGTFESGAAPFCHRRSWTDDAGQEWLGIPLWLMVGRVDDDNVHKGDAFNREVAKQGYRIEVVAADGYKAVFDSDLVTENDKIILAYLANQEPLEEKFFPLRLVGEGLKKNQMVGQVASVNVILPGAGSPAPTSTPAPPPTATPAPAAPLGPAALVVKGAVDNELTLSLATFKELGVVDVTAEHPKQGSQKYQGVRLSVLLEKAGVKSTAKSLVLKAGDGYAAEGPLGDLRACADCLVAIGADGKLTAVMPGLTSNFWVKDLATVELK